MAEKTDRRGTPKGAGTVANPKGGVIGNPPFEPTEQMRADVVAWTKAGLTTEDCGTLLNVSRQTIERHFKRERAVAKIETKRAIAGKLTMMALKGDKTCMIFWLRTQAKWNVRVEHTGEGGGPIRTIDLSGFSLEEQRMLLPLIDRMMSQTGALIDEDGDVVENGRLN